ncbi:MAG: MIP family channel protein [Oscillospiraceae bacterium]|nr:MIP family channel protein [Oscillospiraceae bacterium]MCL2279112.1 MIP family channel protein [Oscillospiraceae bacterium]
MKKYLAEIIGTMVLVFMGCGAAVVLGADAGVGHLPVALAFGLSIVAMAYVIGNVSGCHINPAVSLGVFLDKRINAKEFCGYVVSQIVGATIGALLLFILVQVVGVYDHTGGLGSNGVANAGGIGGGLFVEIILTFIFVLTILGVTADSSKGNVAGIVIGLTLAFVHIVGIPLTGTSVNPARSIGPALFSGGQALTDLWVFIVGPLAGAALAALLYRILKDKKGAK